MLTFESTRWPASWSRLSIVSRMLAVSVCNFSRSSRMSSTDRLRPQQHV